jgi:hypothetical protein
VVPLIIRLQWETIKSVVGHEKRLQRQLLQTIDALLSTDRYAFSTERRAVYVHEHATILESDDRRGGNTQIAISDGMPRHALLLPEWSRPLFCERVYSTRKKGSESLKHETWEADEREREVNAVALLLIPVVF